jgi:penicillin-binding protein 1A
VFVGFDEPVTLGDHETGATTAAPIFRDFMAEALKDKPPTPFRVPSGIRLVRVNAATGRPAQPGDTNVIYEAFKPETVPSGSEEQVLDNDAGIMGLGYGGIQGLGAAEDQPGVAEAPDGGGVAAQEPTAPVTPLPPGSPPANGPVAAPPGQQPSTTAPASPVPQAGGLY